jgi:Protein of unknown function (DUF4256)
MKNSISDEKQLSQKQHDELLAALKARFDANKARHPGLVWAKLQARLEARPDKLWSLAEMERTGGEPDVVGHDKKSGEFVFMDCSAQSPKGRVSICYDRAALDVVHQTRSNLFGWRGQFTPEFVAQDLREAAITRALRDDSRRAMHHCSTNR